MLSKPTIKQTSKIWQESFKWEFEAYPFFCSAYQKAAVQSKNKYYVSWGDFLSYFHNGHHIGLKPKNSVIIPGRRAIDELISGKDEGFLTMFSKTHKEMRDAIEICLKIRRKDANVPLEQWWPKAQNALSNASYILFGFDFALNEFLEKMQNNFPEEFACLSGNIHTNKLSFINEAESRLVELDNKYDDFKKVYDEFIGEYGWFQNSYKGVFGISQSWLKKYLKDIKKENIVTDKKRKLEKLPKKYRLLAKAASRGIIFRDDKKKLLLIAVELMEKWLRNACEENGWKFEAMRWLSMDEILEILNKKNKNIQEADKYAKDNARYGILTVDGYNKVTKEFWEKALLYQQADKNIKEIKGLCANKGVCIGKVRVILNPKAEMKKFNKNDILVTSMTRPEFLPLMRVASAFITDEGGITCHAAIIAREMNKPCIIGTKIATKVLKDGDMVEVDANKGVVKIIK